MAQEKNDVQNQMESALVRKKEALKQELEDKVTLDKENTMKIVQLNEELEKAKKEIEAHDELKSILLAENEDLKTSNKEQSFLKEELVLEKIKLEKELMEARANDQKRSQGHQRLVEERQGEISKDLIKNHELKEAMFTVTKKNEGLREQLENKVQREKNLNGKIVRMTNVEDQMKKELSAAKNVISSLKKELQKRDLENVIKDEGMGDVERCEAAAEDDKTVVVVKEEKQEGKGPTRKLLGQKAQQILLNIRESGDFRKALRMRKERYRQKVLVGRAQNGLHILTMKYTPAFHKVHEIEEMTGNFFNNEELDGVSEETEAVISRKDPLLSGEEKQMLLRGGAGSVLSNRDVQVQVHPGLLTSNREVEVQVEPGPISNTDVTVQTDGDTEIEDLRRKNETMANELANKQAVIEAHENQLVDYYQSIQELKAQLKMAQEKNDIQNQMESALLNEELEKAKKEIEAHDELKSILLAENEVLKISNKEQSFLNKELALEKIKLEKELMKARANDQKRSQGHQRLVEDLQEDQMKKELSAAKDVISLLKKKLQKRDLENVIKDEGMGDVERCEAAAEDDKTVVVVKEEKQEGERPKRKLLVRKPKKKKPKRDKFSWAPPWSRSSGFGNKRK
ncbi:coiled-coil domain-containing protein 18-like [Palaemon carinicauda]|uniref:coiled-coil domain-containing protein 18-like n=1 Tax=Palaemon carinicauda TaxID=392227 RepID=UPI0035B66C2D